MGQSDAADADRQPRARVYARWQDRVVDIAASIIEGVPLEPACVLAGVSHWTVRHALDRDAADAAPIADALAQHEAELAKTLVKQAKGSAPHKGCLDVLERRFPKRWHQSSKVEMVGKDDGPIETVAVVPTEAELRARLALLAEKLGGGG